MPRIGLPESILGRRERGSEVGQLECPNHAPTVVGMNLRRRRGVELRKLGMCPLGADLVVERSPPLARARSRRRWKLEPGKRGAEIEPRAPRDDRCSPAREDVVDRLVREALVFADRDVRLERHHADEPRRVGRERRSGSGCRRREPRSRPRRPRRRAARAAGPPRRSCRTRSGRRARSRQILKACSISPGTRSGTISRFSSGCVARHSLNHSTARGIPASSGVFGSQPSFSRALLMSAT